MAFPVMRKIPSFPHPPPAQGQPAVMVRVQVQPPTHSPMNSSGSLSPDQSCSKLSSRNARPSRKLGPATLVVTNLLYPSNQVHERRVNRGCKPTGKTLARAPGEPSGCVCGLVDSAAVRPTFRRTESGLTMAAVTKGLLCRSAATAKCNMRLVSTGIKPVAFGVDDRYVPVDHKRSMITNSDTQRWHGRSCLVTTQPPVACLESSLFVGRRGIED